MFSFMVSGRTAPTETSKNVLLAGATATFYDFDGLANEVSYFFVATPLRRERQKWEEVALAPCEGHCFFFKKYNVSELLSLKSAGHAKGLQLTQPYCFVLHQNPKA